MYLHSVWWGQRFCNSLFPRKCGSLSYSWEWVLSSLTMWGEGERFCARFRTMARGGETTPSLGDAVSFSPFSPRDLFKNCDQQVNFATLLLHVAKGVSSTVFLCRAAHVLRTMPGTGMFDKAPRPRDEGVSTVLVVYRAAQVKIKWKLKNFTSQPFLMAKGVSTWQSYSKKEWQ